MNYDETMTLLKDIQTDTRNKMRDLEEYILHQQELLEEKTEEIIKIKKQINSKILEITEEINDFTNTKEYKEYKDTIDRLWIKRIVLEELQEEIDS
jgi:hypothetical protein